MQGIRHDAHRVGQIQSGQRSDCPSSSIECEWSLRSSCSPDGRDAIEAFVRHCEVFFGESSTGHPCYSVRENGQKPENDLPDR